MKTVLSAAAAASVLVLMTACSPAKKEEAPPPAAAAPTPVAAEGTSIERLDPALDAIIAPGAVVEKVAGGFKFVEGPLWVHNAIWFADLVGNKLHAVGADGVDKVLIDHSGGLDNPPEGSYSGSNGMVVDKDGSVLMTQHGLRRIVRLDADLKPTTVIDKYQGKKINSPNDLVFRPDGSLWFTDPPMGLVKQDQDPAKELKFNAVWRYKDGVLTPVITDLSRPNGIAFSPDGKKLYISNSGPKMFVNVYDVADDGTVGKAKTFISYPGPVPNDVPDGLRVDSAGNVWTTGPGGIRIVSPEGKVLGQIKSPDLAQANLAFGGPDLKTVYIMAATNVYRLKASIPGETPLYSNNK